MLLFLEHVLLNHTFEKSVAYLIRLQLVSCKCMHTYIYTEVGPFCFVYVCVYEI